MPGTVDLQRWLERNAGGVSWGIMRCEKWGKDAASLHAEGRALDWHLDAANAADRREATRLISLLLAPDSMGNQAALARRMGIQEIIWNCESWFGGDTTARLLGLLRQEGQAQEEVDRDDRAHGPHPLRAELGGRAREVDFWAR